MEKLNQADLKFGWFFNSASQEFKEDDRRQIPQVHL